MGTFVFICLLLATSPFSVYADHLHLVGGQSTTLEIVPSVPVSNSPGAKPGIDLLAERVQIHGLSRMKNLEKFSHAVTVKVSHLNSSLRQPNVEVCFHRNLSLGIGLCPRTQWQKLSNGSWSRNMSPFDHKLLDIRMASSSVEALELAIEEEISAYRIVFLVLGTVLIALAPTFSGSIIFYYSSAMAVGIILVIIVVLFQGMKLLPTGRGNSLAIFVYSSLIGIGSFLFQYLPHLLHMMLAETGVSEDLYYPLGIFLLLFISLAGAWLGFWVVRKVVLNDDGSVDTTIAQFVAWSIRILGAVMIIQCSLDPLVSAEALASAILVSSLLRKAPRLLRRSYRKTRKAAGRSQKKSMDYSSSPPDGKCVNGIQYSEDVFLSTQSRHTTQSAVYSSVKGLPNKSPRHPPSESETFYSTYHTTPDRRKFSDDEWKAFTRDCTKKGLEELVSSPDFSRWAVAHAERITLAPIEKENVATGRWLRWFSWFR